MNNIQYNKWKPVIILSLFLCSVAVFFPGSYSVDSWNMYNQMITGRFTDWHSPALIFVWKALLICTGRFYAIFVFQMALYWTFIYFLLVKINSNRTAFRTGLFISVLLLFIPQYVMKDTHNCIVWGLASLILIMASREQKKYRLTYAAVCLLLLFYGLFVRINGIIALLPLLYIFIETYTGNRLLLWKKVTISIMLLFIAMSCNYFINYSVAHAERTYPQYKLKLLDVIGISKYSGENYIPVCISSYEGFNEKELFKNYSPASVDDLYWPPDGSRSMIPDPNERLNKCLDSSWKSALIQHPIIYLLNRGEGFLYYLKIKRRFSPNEYWNASIWIDPGNPLNLRKTDNFITKPFGKFYTIVGFTPFFDPWFWLLLNVCLFIYYIRRVIKETDIYFFKTQALIQLSAVLYVLSQFPVYQHDRDFRYNYWNVIVALIGFICLPVKENSIPPAKK